MHSRWTARPLASSLDNSPATASPGAIRRIKRFDGINKSWQIWDGLRKDPELWDKDGDCAVHFYAPHTSQRGPSLRIPLKALEQTKSRYLLDECLHTSEPSSPLLSEDDNSDSGYAGSISNDERPKLHCAELYIAAPAHATREEALMYHLTSRNYIAWLLDVPLVGRCLGTALVELWKRINLWQPSDMAASDFGIYCQEQGYFTYSENPDYALASLCLAEQTTWRDLWTEAFAHAVGMRERLEYTEEIEGLSNTTKALLDRASCDMDLHIARVTRSLGLFLEDELGPDILGLSKPLRDHLDRFKSALHSYYVHEFGYFPPCPNQGWSKPLWQSMYEDFRCLYEYLADTESCNDRTSSRGLNGGVCVKQNLQAYNERHNFNPLPHPLPLLPEDLIVTSRYSLDVQKSMRSFRLGRSDTPVSASTKAELATQAFARATNSHRDEITGNPLVQEYIRFERAKLVEKVPSAEARKVRWILVYSTLQLLISITRAPSEVRDTQSPSYPLCVVDTYFPHWMEAEVAWSASSTPNESLDESPSEPNVLETVEDVDEEDRISIHPDCEADCAEDYFAMNAIIRSESDLSSSLSLTRRPSQLSRSTSIRSSVSSLHRSVVGSLSRKHSRRRSSLMGSEKWSPSQSISTTLLETLGTEPEQTSPMEDLDEESDARQALGMEHTSSSVPTLEMHQLTFLEDRGNREAPIDSPASGDCDSKPQHTSSSDFSTFDFGIPKASRQSNIPETYQAKRPANSSRSKVSAGTYQPSGQRPEHVTSESCQQKLEMRGISVISAA